MGDPLFPCLECRSRGAHQEFSLRDLEEHLGREHFGISFYSCPKCKEDFVTKSKISEHIKTACKMERLPKTEEFTKNILHYGQEIFKLIEKCVNQSIVYRIQNSEILSKNEEKEPKIKENGGNLAGSSKIPVKFEPPDENQQNDPEGDKIPGPATNEEESIRSNTRIEFKEEFLEAGEALETEKIPENQEISKNQETTDVVPEPNLPTVLQTLLKIHFPKDSEQENVKFGPEPQWHEDQWISGQQMGPEANSLIQNGTVGLLEPPSLISTRPGAKKTPQKRIRAPRKPKSKRGSALIQSEGAEKGPETNLLPQNGPAGIPAPSQFVSEFSPIIPMGPGAEETGQMPQKGAKPCQSGSTISPESGAKKSAEPSSTANVLEAGLQSNLEGAQQGPEPMKSTEIITGTKKLDQTAQEKSRTGPETTINSPEERQTSLEPGEIRQGSETNSPESGIPKTNQKFSQRGPEVEETAEIASKSSKQPTARPGAPVFASGGSQMAPGAKVQTGIRPGPPVRGSEAAQASPAARQTDQMTPKSSKQAAARPGARPPRWEETQMDPGEKQTTNNPSLLKAGHSHFPAMGLAAKKKSPICAGTQKSGPTTKKTPPGGSGRHPAGHKIPKIGGGPPQMDPVPSLMSFPCPPPMIFGPGAPFPPFGPSPPFPAFGIGPPPISAAGPTIFPSSMRLSGPYGGPQSPFFPPGPAFMGQMPPQTFSMPNIPTETQRNVPKGPGKKGKVDPQTKNGPDSREQAEVILSSQILAEMLKTGQKSKSGKRKNASQQGNESSAKKSKNDKEPVVFPPSKGLLEPGFKIPRKSSFSKLVGGKEAEPAPDSSGTGKNAPENRVTASEPLKSQETRCQIPIKPEPFEGNPNRTPPASPAPEPVPEPSSQKEPSPTSSHPKITPPTPETSSHPRITPPDVPRFPANRSTGLDLDDLELFDEVEGDDEDDIIIYDYGQPIPQPIGVKREPETAEEELEDEEEDILYVGELPPKKKNRNIPSLMEITVDRPRRDRIQPPSPEPRGDREHEEEGYLCVKFPEHVCEYESCCMARNGQKKHKNPCPFCIGFHAPTNCATVTNLWNRKVACFFNRHCIRCLGSHPLFDSNQCKKILCNFCKKSNHPTALCSLPGNKQHRQHLNAIKLSTELPLTPEILEITAKRRMDLEKVEKDQRGNPRLIES